MRKILTTNLLLLAIITICSLGLNAEAATYTVDRTDDDATATGCDDNTNNDCSLRGAIIKANGNANHPTVDEIIVPAGEYILDIVRNTETGQDTANQVETEGDIDITEALTITGAGADMTTIKADDSFDDRLFHPSPDPNAGDITFRGLTFDGNNRPSSDRGGLFYFVRNGYTGIIEDCQVKNGNASDGGGVAMNANVDLEIRNSTISDNTGSGRGGGLFCETGTCLVLNSTFSNNTSTSNTTGGGAIQNDTGTLTIINSTIVDNDASDANGSGGGLLVGFNVTIKNSILARNTHNGADENCAGNLANVTSEGYNLSDDSTCNTALDESTDQNSVTGTIVATNLADNGGPTPTHTLPDNSPAIDEIPAASCTDENDAALTEDQRGFTRPLDSSGGTASCDVGAVEVGCGNGQTEAGEDCDDSGESATCDDDCTNAECGDNTVNSTAGEQCDDGNTDDGDGCSSTCESESGGVCGDGTVDTGEECDDGNNDDGDGCANNCTLETENDLEATNPNVDFDNLTESQAVELTAPDPTGSSLVLAQTFPDDCTFAWTVDPAARGSYSDATAQTTDFTPGDAGTGQITIVVTCTSGGSTSTGTFSQSIVVNAASSGSSGGCSLIRR